MRGPVHWLSAWPSPKKLSLGALAISGLAAGFAAYLSLLSRTDASSSAHLPFAVAFLSACLIRARPADAPALLMSGLLAAAAVVWIVIGEGAQVFLTVLETLLSACLSGVLGRWCLARIGGRGPSTLLAFLLVACALPVIFVVFLHNGHVAVSGSPPLWSDTWAGVLSDVVKIACVIPAVLSVAGREVSREERRQLTIAAGSTLVFTLLVMWSLPLAPLLIGAALCLCAARWPTTLGSVITGVSGLCLLTSETEALRSMPLGLLESRGAQTAIMALSLLAPVAVGTMTHHALGLSNMTRQGNRDVIRFLEFVCARTTHAMSYWDANGTCRFANDAYGILVGQSAEQCTGLSLQGLGDSPFARLQKALIQSGLKGGSKRREESVLLSSGEELQAVFESFPDCAPREQVRGVLLLISDMTSLKQAKSDLRKMNEMLTEQVRRAEEASEAKSAFLMNVSHELRTPLNAILGICYLLRQPKSDAERSSLLTKMDGSARNLLEIIDNVIDLERIAAHKVALSQEGFRIESLIDDLRKDVESLEAGGAARIQVEAHFPKELRILGDRTRLHQVLFHLLDNALKFSAGGLVKLTIKELSRGDRTVMLSFGVSDTGQGINPERIPLLFEAFTQGDSSSTRPHGGTGIGLTLVQHLVGMMGGQVQVESSLGLGSHFHFTLQLPIERTGDESSKRRERVGVLGNVDDALLQQCFSLEFSSQHFVDVKEFFQARLNFQNRIDVLIVDVQEEAASKERPLAALLQALSPALRPWVLAVGSPTDATRHFADAHLPKPTTARSLREAIHELLSRQTQEPESVAIPALKTDFDLQGIRVLVVDDSDINVTVAKTILEQFGAQVGTASDGEQALSVLSQNPTGYDLVLMDVQMPNMDGNAATRAIRSTPALRHIPVVGMSAGALEAQQGESLSAGMNAFLKKPFRPEAMVEAVIGCAPLSELLRGRSAPQKAPSPEPKNQSYRVPGVDMADARVRLVDDPEFIISLVRSFLVDFEDIETEWSTDLGEGSLHHLTRQMHKLRGAASNLSILRVAASAEALEDWLIAGARDPRTDRASKEKALRGHFDAIRRALAEVREGLPPEVKAAESRRERRLLPPSVEGRSLRRLRSALAQRNFEAVQLFLDSTSLLQESLTNEAFLHLKAAMDQLDFRKAEELLK